MAPYFIAFLLFGYPPSILAGPYPTPGACSTARVAFIAAHPMYQNMAVGSVGCVDSTGHLAGPG